MVFQPFQATPENLNVASEAIEEGRSIIQAPPLQPREPIQLDTALPPELAQRVVEQAVRINRATRSRLTVEREGESASLELPLRIDPAASTGFRLITPVNDEVDFSLDVHTNQRITIRFNVRYAGLPLDKALSYLRFLQALLWSEGTLYLDRLEPDEERIELLPLPLSWDTAIKDDVENRVRFLEALSEINRATGSEFVHPSETNYEDLQNLNHVLKAIRVGWLAIPINDFTTPMNAEGVKNVLELVAEEGEVLRSFAMTSEGEQVRIFGVWVNLGPSVRYISAARLDTPPSEMEAWLSSSPGPDESFDIKWVPIQEAPFHILYQDWPKPSLESTQEDIRAFEEESGRSSEEFRRAWEDGESWARELEGSDVWLTLLDVEHHLEHGA